MQKLLQIKEYFEELRKGGYIVEEHYASENTNDIINLTYNSKNASEGTLFICKGEKFKEEYLYEALGHGAIGYVADKRYDLTGYNGIAEIIVTDIRRVMPVLACMYTDEAWKKLKLTGITGTKGKTTTAYYIKAIIDDYLYAHAKKESAIISSIDVYDGVSIKESHITTPEAVELHEHFLNAVNSSIEYLDMEVSSQALKYDRVDGIKFNVGVFLNISEDHISALEHKDFEDYFSSKLTLFKYTDVACVNLDADYADRIMEAAKKCSTVITFGTKPDCDIYGYDIRKEDDEIAFEVKCSDFDTEFRLTMPGLFNVENALAAIAVTRAYNIPLKYIKSGLYRAKSSGRMEKYVSHDGKAVAIVDYAHNKLSFERLLESTMKEYPDSRIEMIFGCPGKKALLRRENLGTIAGMHSDKVYIVAEDPGDEPVEDISREIAGYVAKQDCPYEMIEDRGCAIKKAIESIEEKTVILITGKGNETRQKYGSEYIDCPSDVAYVKKYIGEYNNKHCKSLGILGGMGPAASVFFYKNIIDRTKAKSDQDHMDMVILNHASMPDRTEALMTGDTAEIIDLFIADIKKLEKMGVGNIAIPCNTSHAFFDEMQSSVNVPIINMVEESIKYAVKSVPNLKKIGIMATDGTLRCGVYKRECEKYGIECLVPSVEKQADVMHIIYSEVKKGRKLSKERFDGVVEEFVGNGAGAIILACTELSVYKEYESVPDICIDAMDVLISESIRRSGYCEINTERKPLY